jgi:hypothetical protein
MAALCESGPTLVAVDRGLILRLRNPRRIRLLYRGELNQILRRASAQRRYPGAALAVSLSISLILFLFLWLRTEGAGQT